ncbi:MAG TPA: preprotein translocase subunit SecE [Acidimicrobiia bacterium]|nr:preprotein translocase subunit SecE [Acidimicrobiia bacterium]
MNREMRRLMEREERLQKRDQGKGGSGKGPRAPRPGGPGNGGGPGGPVVERKPIWVRLGNFLHEVRQELKKVSWPSREQMVAFTAITLVVTSALTLIIFGLDVAMKEAVITLLQP